MNYTSYLFDFDYTLADSSRGIVTCFRNVFDRRQFSDITDEAIKRTIGKTLRESFSILTGITDPEQLTSMQKEYGREADIHMNVNTVLFPETVAVLTKLKEQGAQIGIVSTKYRFRIKSFLNDYFPDDFFDVIIGGEDVESHKLSPEGIFLALAQLGCTCEETLYVGDSDVDAETAQAARMDFAGVLTGMTTVKELRIYPHRAILTNLNDLLLPPPQKVKKNIFRNKLRKWVAVRRMLHIKRIRGRSIPQADLEEVTICKNCGHTFTGNYCNHCAQSKKVERFNFRSAIANALSAVSSIDRGFGYTLLELIYRPGYMISDYIAGKRVRYFRPFQTLFILAAVYILLVQFIDPDALKKDDDNRPAKKEQTTDTKEQTQAPLNSTQDRTGKKVTAQDIKEINKSEDSGLNQSNGKKTQDDEDESTESSPDRIDKFVDSIEDNLAGLSEKKLTEGSFLDRVWNILKNWAHGNKAFSIILTLPLFALATRMAFRKRTYNRRYNYTEHIFVQTYIACQILIVSTILLLLRGKAELNNVYDISNWGMFLLFTWDYKQLFHGTWWQTIRRTILMFFYSLLLLILIAFILVALIVAVAFLLKSFGIS
ncbi:HAD-IA family hydrolase [Proteiniphilum sp.]|uniref:HAD-IA family hydrolase n=1 Tax=Proteiniphilum sp. TaxID=1926877 RepID=UPI002B2098AC|nr:HAD-IA family hydrolase [Proteiniphilum sp.]MEA4919080.1 HAD-IA family hydrolase [Proteiniphilum sp.]